MQTTRKTSLEIPSLGKSKLRISPYKKTSPFMELHRLDYEHNNLVHKLDKLDLEKEQVLKQITALDREMRDMLSSLNRRKKQ